PTVGERRAAVVGVGEAGHRERAERESSRVVHPDHDVLTGAVDRQGGFRLAAGRTFFSGDVRFERTRNVALVLRFAFLGALLTLDQLVELPERGHSRQAARAGHPGVHAVGAAGRVAFALV